ncbi:MAG: hypothetical protein J6332_07760 [Abditibacteriota bacterium]|nr:hypothetical protein [Abditibacteriota bacterium]
MSNLIKSLVKYARESGDKSLKIVSAEIADEEHSLGQSLEIRRGRADIVDPAGRLDGREVGAPEHGKIRYFLDGIERKHIPAYMGNIPLVYGYVAACVRVRGEDKRMRTHDFAFDESFYLPTDLMDVSPLTARGIKVTDSKPEEDTILKMGEYARAAIGDKRGRLERQLSRKWIREMSGRGDYLLVDGSLIWTLGGNQERFDNPNIIGAVKSHPTQYFDAEGQSLIFALREGERSGIFQPYAGESLTPVYSWYLRLRNPAGHDLSFGLIRVDAPADNRALENADMISRWLLAERNPIALPDGRWDRMFYTIRDCEQYLRSKAPSEASIRAWRV